MEEVREAGRATVGGNLREEQDELKQEVQPERRAPAASVEMPLGRNRRAADTTRCRELCSCPRSHLPTAGCIGRAMLTALRTVSGGSLRRLRHAGVDALREEAGDEDEGGHVKGVDHIEEIRDTAGRPLDREQHVADHHQGDQDALCVVELQISFLHKNTSLNRRNRPGLCK